MNAAAKNTRIYLAVSLVNGEEVTRMIEAGTAASARNHATKNMIVVKPATPKQVAAFMMKGVVLETANPEPEEQQPLVLDGAATGSEDQADNGTGGEQAPSAPVETAGEAPAEPGDEAAAPAPAQPSRRRR